VINGHVRISFLELGEPQRIDLLIFAAGLRGNSIESSEIVKRQPARGPESPTRVISVRSVDG
jgi:hypothetical protein